MQNRPNSFPKTFLTIWGFIFPLDFWIWWTERRGRKYVDNLFLFIWLEQQIMKHLLNIISFSALWFRNSLDAGPADQMVHLTTMALKWRLEFRSTGLQRQIASGGDQISSEGLGLASSAVLSHQSPNQMQPPRAPSSVWVCGCLLCL